MSPYLAGMERCYGHVKIYRRRPPHGGVPSSSLQTKLKMVPSKTTHTHGQESNSRQRRQQQRQQQQKQQEPEQEPEQLQQEGQEEELRRNQKNTLRKGSLLHELRLEGAHCMKDLAIAKFGNRTKLFFSSQPSWRQTGSRTK